MIDTIYVESAVRQHHRVESLLRRYPKARVIECTKYQEIFNRRKQNFRVQKAHAALILAEKSSPLLYSVPGEQHLGAAHNYYFSHLLNCPFDCRYCFLQGMFTSANYVLFVNYEAFVDGIADICARHTGPIHFFSGYDCDSLALEPLTGFAAHFIEAIAGFDNAVLELRTKSTQIRSLLARAPHDRCVVAMSLAPNVIAQNLEHGAPSLADRLGALRRLQEHGWPIGLRFDPILPLHDGVAIYEHFFAAVFNELDAAGVHSATLGSLRLPRSFAKRLFRLYPEEPLFASSYEELDGTFVFGGPSDVNFLMTVRDNLSRYMPCERIFTQHDTTK